MDKFEYSFIHIWKLIPSQTIFPQVLLKVLHWQCAEIHALKTVKFMQDDWNPIVEPESEQKPRDAAVTNGEHKND